MLKFNLKLLLQIYICLGIQLIVNTLIFPVNAQEFDSENWQKKCRPEIDQSQNQNIIGYGSLMESNSRLRSTPNIEKAYPVMLSGYRRGWYVNNPNNPMGATFLGVVPDTNKQLNAVVYTLPEKSGIKNLDLRESGYCRQEIKPDQLQILSGNLPSGQFWIYSYLSQPQNPNPNAPIVQSYVDIFLGGCLEQEEEYKLKNFAQQCINTTENWTEVWINDRLYPRRPFIYQPKAFQIDSLIRENLPQFFDKIQIE